MTAELEAVGPALDGQQRAVAPTMTAARRPIAVPRARLDRAQERTDIVLADDVVHRQAPEFILRIAVLRDRGRVRRDDAKPLRIEQQGRQRIALDQQRETALIAKFVVRAGKVRHG